jgi:integrase
MPSPPKSYIGDGDHLAWMALNRSARSPCQLADRRDSNLRVLVQPARNCLSGPDHVECGRGSECSPSPPGLQGRGADADGQGEDHGQAFIRHGEPLRPVGGWYGRWRDANGKLLNRKVGAIRSPGERDGLTKTQAEQRLRGMVEDDSRLAPVVERVTVAEAVDALVSRLRMRGAKKSYLQTVESTIRVHLKTARQFRNQDLGRLNEHDVERYIDAKLRAGLAPKTIRNHLGVLHSIFALGQRRKWCVQNPVKLAEGPKVRRNKTRIRFLTQEEIEALLRVDYPDDAFGTIEPTLYLVAAMTGLRHNELIALAWRHVDWLSQRIRVVTGYVRGEFNDPKSGESSRSVPMATRVAQELELLFQRSRFQADDDLVFGHPELGTPLDRSKVLKRLRAAEKRAGVRQVTFHELRHTFGTRCAAAGVPMRTIQEWLGHEDADTTAIYAHYQPAAREVSLVDRAFELPEPQLEDVPDAEAA